MNSLLNIVYELHEKSVYLGSGLNITTNEFDSVEDSSKGEVIDIEFG